MGGTGILAAGGDDETAKGGFFQSLFIHCAKGPRQQSHYLRLLQAPDIQHPGGDGG